MAKWSEDKEECNETEVGYQRRCVTVSTTNV